MAGNKGRLTRLEVVERHQLTPHMVRLVCAGPGGTPLADFPMPDHTDAYVKVVLPPPGASYAEPFDVERVRAEYPAEQWPLLRTYTIRWFDVDSGHLALDFVVHGDEGVAGPWAASAQVGAEFQIRGPGGGYSPDPDAAWHLLVGDESALPAIAAALERLAPGALAHVFIEVSDASEEQPLVTAAETSVTWVHRESSKLPPGEELVAAVKDADLPGDGVHAFVHGDAGFVRELRTFLRVDRNVPRERLSISGYWRRGSTDEQWRAAKRAWAEQAEAEEVARASG